MVLNFYFFINWENQTRSFTLIPWNCLQILKILPVTNFRDPKVAILTLKMYTWSCLWLYKVIPEADCDKLILAHFPCSLWEVRTRERRPITEKEILRRVSVSIFKISKYRNFNVANKKLIIVEGSEKLLNDLKKHHTATEIPFIYSFPGNSAASAPISIFMCLWAIYIFPGSVYIFPPAEKADPSWEYIIRSQTHECGNWDWGPDIPFLGIFVSNFRHFVFAVQRIHRKY
jgi:hypothetical protein